MLVPIRVGVGGGGVDRDQNGEVIALKGSASIHQRLQWVIEPIRFSAGDYQTTLHQLKTQRGPFHKGDQKSEITRDPT